MTSSARWMLGVLNFLIRRDLTGCPRAAGHAAMLLERLADSPELDGETRRLCEQMSSKLAGEAAGDGR